MGLVSIEETSAGTPAGSDLMLNSGEFGVRLQRKPYPRLIKRIALTGSAAAGDCAIKLKIDGKDITGKIYNSRTGKVPLANEDFREINKVIPPNMALQAIIETASSTNPMILHIELYPE